MRCCRESCGTLWRHRRRNPITTPSLIIIPLTTISSSSRRRVSSSKQFHPQPPHPRITVWTFCTMWACECPERRLLPGEPRSLRRLRPPKPRHCSAAIHILTIVISINNCTHSNNPLSNRTCKGTTRDTTRKLWSPRGTPAPQTEPMHCTMAQATRIIW